MDNIITINGTKYIKMEALDYKPQDTFKTKIKQYCQKLGILYDSFDNMFPDGDVTDLFWIEKKYFIDNNYNAIVFTYKNRTIIMLPISILNYFEFKDHFYIKDMCHSIYYNWGGTSFDPDLSSKTVSYTNGGSKSAKISRVSFFHGYDAILEVISIIREYYHRVFYALNFRGTGKNYKNLPDSTCNCLGCLLEKI